MTLALAARPFHRPLGSRDRYGRCLRRVPDVEAIAAARRAVSLRLREVREQLDIAVAELAAAIGVHCSTISRWEAGERSPSLPRIYQIAAALGVRTVDLLAEDV